MHTFVRSLQDDGQKNLDEGGPLKPILQVSIAKCYT